ncbi:MAG: cohesin domain-containing protein, partial [Bacteroidales bacterium]|nr:cohesin domain-containing protein [Bacteroidales bacterium]
MLCHIDYCTMMKQNQRSYKLGQPTLNTVFVIILLLFSHILSAQSDNLITGSPTNCKESINSVDYQNYFINNPKPDATYTWTITGDADFNSSSTAVGTNVNVRFLQNTGTVTLSVIESINDIQTASSSLEINKNLRPQITSIDGPTGWGAVCLTQKNVLYTAHGINATSFVWTVPEGNTITSQTDNSIRVDFNEGTGNFSVFAQNGEGCLSYQGLHPYISPQEECIPEPACEIVLAVSDAETCKGQDFSIDVNMQDIDSCGCIVSYKFYVDYDNSIMEYTGTDSSITDMGNGELAIMVLTDGTTTYTGGNLASLQFTALDNGTADVAVNANLGVDIEG